ncbi:MAG: amidohydrolase family protein [Gemmatimonadaceae bacterium]|nr:amidohydrolase family protein [Gemmatimonadaceae bacterium]
MFALISRTFLLAGLASVALAQGAAPNADLIVTNARIYTSDDTRPVVEAVAVAGGKVLFAGNTAGAMALKGAATRILDLGGRTVIPGMIDAHGHVTGLGDALHIVDLTGTSTYDEVVARVAERAKATPKGQWVLGRGWDQNDWGDTRFPTHDKMTAAVPDHPVYIVRVDGHAGLANLKALQAAGVTAASQDPSGGHIERAADGSPSGVFVDNAQGLVRRAIPRQTRDDVKLAIVDAVREAQRWGLTGVHDAGAGATALDVYEELAKSGQMKFRLYAMISDDAPTIDAWFKRGPLMDAYNGSLWVRSIKLYSDGALGSRGAALLEPYSDDPKNIGLLVSAPAHIQDVATRALKAGFQINTHAIGDRGNRLVLDAYAAALKAAPTADHRFRVEHAQILNFDDVSRFASLGVIPSMQASHQTSDMYWAGARLGAQRLLGAYAWRSLLNTGVVVPNGSDFPVEQVNPLISFHSAVSRQDARDWPPGGWYPAERMTREEALKSITIWAAYSGFQEKVLGSLTPGKYADFVVLDQDIMRVPPELLLRTKVLQTWVGGTRVYEAAP